MTVCTYLPEPACPYMPATACLHLPAYIRLHTNLPASLPAPAYCLQQPTRLHPPTYLQQPTCRQLCSLLAPSYPGAILGKWGGEYKKRKIVENTAFLHFTLIAHFTLKGKFRKGKMKSVRVKFIRVKSIRVKCTGPYILCNLNIY